MTSKELEMLHKMDPVKHVIQISNLTEEEGPSAWYPFKPEIVELRDKIRENMKSDPDFVRMPFVIAQKEIGNRIMSLMQMMDPRTVLIAYLQCGSILYREATLYQQTIEAIEAGKPLPDGVTFDECESCKAKLAETN